MGRVISTAIQFIDGFTRPSQAVINSMRNMGNEAIKAGKQIQNAGKTISSVGSTLTTAITLPVAGVATAAVKTAADFEAAMTEVKVVAGATAQEFELLKDEAKRLGATTKFSAIESAEAMQYMAQAGWDTQAILEGTAGVMNAAASSGESLSSVANILAKNITAFGDSASDATMYADVLAAAAAVSAADVNYLGESFKYCASTAGSMGYSVQDMSIALAALSQGGIEAGTAGSSLRNIIANMAKPTKAQAAVMQELGLSLTDNQGRTKDFATVMNDLRNSFKGLSESEAAAAASGLAGKESMAALLTLVNTSDADFANFTNAINNSSGAAENMAKQMQDNLNGQITLLKSGIEGIAITIGDKLLPYIKTAVSWVQTATDFINNLSDAQVNNIMKWAGIAAAIPPIIMIFGKIVTAVGTAQRTFGVITKTVANFGGIVGLITSPAGIVIGVLAAIAVAAVLIIKNWDQVKAFLSNVGAWFKSAFEKAGFTVEGFKSKFTSIGNTIGSIAGKIGGFCKSIAGIFKNEFGAGVTAAAGEINGGLEAIVAGAVTAFDGIVTAVDTGLKVFEGVGTLFKGIFTGDVETALSGFKTAAGGAIDAVGNIFKAKINAIKNFVTGALSTFLPQETVNKIAGAFDVVASAWDIAIGAAKGYIDGFVTAIKPVIENIKTIFKGVAQFVKGVFTGDWKGALNGLKTIASGALSGLVNVIKAPFTLISNTVKGAINTFKSLDIVKTIFTAVGNAIKNVLTKCGVDMNKFSANINNIKTRVGSIINNLKTIFSTVFGAIGKVVKGAASIVAGIFGKKISSTCSAAGAVLTAFKAVAGAAFGFISGAIQKAMNIIVPVVKVAFSAIKGAISAAVQNVTAIISGLLTVFDGITTFISGVFTGNWSKAWEGIKSIFKGVFDSLVALCKTPINAVIGIINGAISGINNLGLTIPDWVPVIGGQSFSINIPTIPMLYKGTNNWQGGAAVIHDRGGEIVDLPKGTRVYPHDKSVEMARKEGAAQSGSGSVSVVIQKLADKIEVRSDEDIDRIAEALALKLKKVAFNTA